MKQIIARVLPPILKVLLGCILGLVIVSFYASRSTVVKHEIEKFVQRVFQEQYQVVLEGQLVSIDLLALRLEFSHTSVTPLEGKDWSLYADSFVASASWIDLIFSQRFSCHGYFKQMIMHQKEPGKSSGLFFFIQQLFSGSMPSNLSFDLLTITDGQVVLEDIEDNISAAWSYNCQISSEEDGMHVQTYFLDGYGHYQNYVLFENLFGSIHVVVPHNGNLSDMFSRIDCRLSLPHLDDKKDCFLVGDVYDGRGSFVLSNQDQSFIIEPCKIRFDDPLMPCTCSINLSCLALQKLWLGDIPLPDVQGDVSVTLQGNLKQGFDTWFAGVHLNKLSYKDVALLDKVGIEFLPTSKGYLSKLFVGSQLILQGILQRKQDWSFSLQNQVSLQAGWNSYWNLPAGKSLFAGSFDKSFNFAGMYEIALQSKKLDRHALTKGKYKLHDTLFELEGTFDTKQYYAKLSWNPVLNVISVLCRDGNKILLDIQSQKHLKHGLHGFIDFNLLKDMVPEKLRQSFSQEGKIDMKGTFEKGMYSAKVATEDAHIRIPGVYNVVKNFQAQLDVDFMHRKVMIKDLIAQLYEGKLHCNKAVAYFEDLLSVSFLHVPLIFDNVLLSWDKGIFGILSGRLLLEKKLHEKRKFHGSMIIEKSQLKGNIFSAEFQKRLFEQLATNHGDEIDCDLDITIETKRPIAVKTSFMQAQANIDMQIQGSTKRPEIAGDIHLLSGELDFPYKPLAITHGRISILGNQSDDPMIEIMAKGKIKRYHVSMRATGTVFDQQIKFESSPYLTEEQILSLLMVGSADSSLSLVMPAFFMQKLKEIIFGPALSKSKLDTMFRNLLKPFKYVRFFPQFSNQSGRGGMRGVVEIDVTDRLQARIDSNFAQIEDTRFELDYAVTDDITVRAVRDKPSMYGGEVEMRWKFS